MEPCDLDPDGISLLVKQHLLPNGVGEDWRAEWGSDCALPEGVTLRIPYDPDEINATPARPLEAEPEPEVEAEPEPEVEAEPEVEPDHSGDADGVAGAGTPLAGRGTNDPAYTNPPQNPTTPLDTRETTQENPMPEGQDQEKTQETTAHVEVDPSAGLTGDLTALAQSTGADPTLTIVLALMAVLGGGTAWKFYRQNSEQKHDQKMAQMKMDAKAKGMEGQSPGPCQTIHAQLKTEVEEMKARLGKIDQKMALTADFDSDDVERKVRRLEKWRKNMEEEDEDDV